MGIDEQLCVRQNGNVQRSGSVRETGCETGNNCVKETLRNSKYVWKITGVWSVNEGEQV